MLLPLDINDARPTPSKAYRKSSEPIGSYHSMVHNIASEVMTEFAGRTWHLNAYFRLKQSPAD